MGTLAAGAQQIDEKVVERNSRRIVKLIHEVEKLVDLLERQRLVDPMILVQLKKELHDIEINK
jgi:hypothetical protein